MTAAANESIKTYATKYATYVSNRDKKVVTWTEVMDHAMVREYAKYIKEKPLEEKPLEEKGMLDGKLS